MHSHPCCYFSVPCQAATQAIPRFHDCHGGFREKYELEEAARLEKFRSYWFVDGNGAGLNAANPVVSRENEDC
jgi:hypothetical protein